MTTQTAATTRTLAAPGATLTYDVREADSAEPVLFLIGAPMGAGGFGTLAGHFTDRTVVTYDPRGVERSIKDDPATRSTPEQHADDLHRIIEALGAGPVDLFASSGGAVNALGPGRGPSGATSGRSSPTSRRWPRSCPTARGPWPPRRPSPTPTSRRGFGAGMARFIAVVSHQGPFTVEEAGGAGPGSGDVRPADRGRRQPDRPAAVPEHHHVHPLRARLRRPPRGADADRRRPSASSPRASSPTGAASPRPSGSAPRPCASPATTAGSSAASTARPATPTRSPPSCARSSPRADPRIAIDIAAPSPGAHCGCPGIRLRALVRSVVASAALRQRREPCVTVERAGARPGAPRGIVAAHRLVAARASLQDPLAQRQARAAGAAGTGRARPGGRR